MARIHGFDHFCEHLKGLEEFYCIIGGGAAAILFEENGLEFRATKDVDFLVLSISEELNRRVLQYIKEGGYETREATKAEPKYYRFLHPADESCPKIIEIFARNQLELELTADQKIIPINDSYGERLSAILLDEEYFALIQKNIIRLESGIPIINAAVNICLKAGAYRDLLARKQAGEPNIDDKDIQKHLKDIWRLAVMLKGDETIVIHGKPQQAIHSVILELDDLPEERFGQVMKDYGVKKDALMDVLKQVFLVQY
ncbi:MAG TPA: hypothetical protein VJR29_05395 [bacterium]|nr:hypothetical protein [bacterium]